jgi:hypothetical protein
VDLSVASVAEPVNVQWPSKIDVVSNNPDARNAARLASAQRLDQTAVRKLMHNILQVAVAESIRITEVLNDGLRKRAKLVDGSLTSDYPPSEHLCPMK